MGWESHAPEKVNNFNMNTVKKTTKVQRSKRFFGRKESEIKDRFIFVEELSDIFINDDDEKKILFLELNVYDSAESDFVQDKAVLVLHEEIYNEIFAFLLCEIDAALKIREGLECFLRIENEVSDFRKLTFKNEEYEQN